MGRRSTVSTHPQREAIEYALSTGVPGAQIARRYGVSESAISRHRISRMDALSRVADPSEPHITGVMQRLVELADDARETRKLTALSGTPVSRARAQSTELAALEKLIGLLGVTDTFAVELAMASTSLVRVIQTLLTDHPEASGDIIAALDEHDELTELADALRAQQREMER